ncbi:MAG: AMP-binding protein [Rhodobiaceae bacterium]|nr:AMP-binding protein [Rhodobiaceae bacterium]
MPLTWGIRPMIDDFAARNLPPPRLWPEIDLSHPAYHYPPRINCVSRFLDRWIAEGRGARRAIVAPGSTWTYQDLYERVNRLAHVLVEDLGLVPGNRVLLRSVNAPMMVAAYLAVIKAGGIAVGTMALLRENELAAIIDKAEIGLALCDAALGEALEKAKAKAPALRRIAYFDNEKGAGEVEKLMAGRPAEFTSFDSRADDICLIAFTSGTTGKPKGTIHFHRDLLAICDGFSALVLKPEPDDLFCGSPPLAFTFGLGGLALFPLHAGSATLLLPSATPPELVAAIEKYRATFCFTAPTAYRVMLSHLAEHDISSLRRAVSAGEHLPKAIYDAVCEATGLKLIDGLGSTEMLHVFITSADEDIRPGATGIPVPGYRAAILDDDGKEVPPGTVGALAVKGPTGCRYLADERQSVYVRNGWNITGDAYLQDEDGYFWFQARADDMIISAGYNIAGPEVENALLTHEAVAECAVVGAPDEERGMIVKAFVVLAPGVVGDGALVKALQTHVKAEIAPYKYPRAIEFVAALPKTGTGKIQRFKLREKD